jgi:hypothetical protein
MMGSGRLDLRPPSTYVDLPPTSLAAASRAAPVFTILTYALTAVRRPEARMQESEAREPAGIR